MRQIQLFKPVFNKEEILKQISECLDKGWTGAGFKTIEFEEEFKKFTKLPNAHFLNSATSGLHLALEIIKKVRYPSGKSVITSPLTFISDSHVIKHAGFEPIFCDVDNTLCMSPTNLHVLLENMYSKLSQIQAVIYIGIGGNTGDLGRIARVCGDYGIPLILDASHMMGTYYKNKHVGSEADFTVFSFQSVKNLPTADSGMLVCKNPEHDKLARKLSWLGISKDTYTRQTTGGNWDYEVQDIGWKYHSNSIMAAMGLAGLKVLTEQNNMRALQAWFYNKKLKQEYHRIEIDSNCTPFGRHLFQVRVPAVLRDDIIGYARGYGIQLGVHYKSHQDYPIYRHYPYTCPNAGIASRELISLPLGPHLAVTDQRYIVEILNDYRF